MLPTYLPSKANLNDLYVRLCTYIGSLGYVTYLPSKPK
jgi:hypothetical protein